MIAHERWPKIALAACQIRDFQAPLKKLISNHFSWYSYHSLSVITPTNVPSYITIDHLCICRIVVHKIWQKMSIIPIFGSYRDFEFFLDYKFEMQNFKTILRHICINYGASQVQRMFCLDSVSNVNFVVFGQYWLTLRVIISISKRDNRLFDIFFEKFKQLAISVVKTVFISNAHFCPKNWPKNLTIMKKFSHTLWRHRYVISINFAVN